MPVLRDWGENLPNIPKFGGFFWFCFVLFLIFLPFFPVRSESALAGGSEGGWEAEALGFYFPL